MAMDGIAEALEQGHSLAVADRVLIDPKPGTLEKRVDELIGAVTGNGSAPAEVCRTLIRLGMNFVGRDAEIVGYGTKEADAALKKVLAAIDGLKGGQKEAMGGAGAGVLADMKSVTLADSLSGLLAERIGPAVDAANPGRTFLEALKKQM